MNLFDKYGGSEFWCDFLNLFYSRITVSQVTRHHFRNKNINHIKEMLLGLLEVTLVAYSHFSDQVMEDTHKNLGITEVEFSEWVRLYSGTLSEVGVSDSDVTYIINILSSYKRFVVTEI